MTLLRRGPTRLALVLAVAGGACATAPPAALYCPVVDAPYHYPEAAWASATEGDVEIERCPVDTGFPPVTVVSGPKALADSVVKDVQAEQRVSAPDPAAPRACHHETFRFRISPTEADVLAVEPPSRLVTRGYERPQIVGRGPLEDAIPEDKWVDGTVKVRALVDPEGFVKDATLLEGTQGTNAEIDGLAVAWVKTFRFCPARLKGKAVSAPYVFVARLRR